MKKAFLLFGVLIFTCSLFAQDRLDLFHNYTIPDIQYRVMNISLNFDGTNSITNENPPSSLGASRIGDNHNTNIYLSSEPRIKWINETEDEQSLFEINFPFYTNYREDEFSGLTPYYISDYHSNTYLAGYESYSTRYISKYASLVPEMNFELRNYSSEDDNRFFLFKANGSLDFTFDRNTNNTRYSPSEYSSSVSYSDDKSQNYEIGIGIGFGKLRDVTPVVTALRFQERLKQISVINENLSDDQINLISSQFAKYDSYESTYDRPLKYFWEDMNKIMTDTNIPFSNANIYSRQYAFESLNELKFRRLEGRTFTISGNVLYNKRQQRQYYQSDYYYYYGHSFSTDPYTETSIETVSPGVVFDFTVSKQKSETSQIHARTLCEIRTNISKEKLFNNYQSASGEIGYDSEITDRIVFQLSNQLNFLISNTSVSQNILTNSFNSQLHVFLENSFSLNLLYNFIYIENTFELSPTSFTYYTRNHALSIGLNYYFDRAMIN